MTETDSSIEKRFNTAVQHHMAGRLSEAEALYRGVLTLDNRHSESLHFLGVMAHQKGDHAKAVDLISTAIAINDTVAAYHFHLGLAAYSLGKLELARASYERAIALKPDFAPAHHGLGNIFKSQNQLGQAVASFRNAHALKPSTAHMYSLAEALLYQRKNVSEALALLEQVAAATPDHHAVQIGIGNALYELGRPVESLQAFERAIEIKPATIRGHSGYLYTLTRTQLMPPTGILARARRFQEQTCAPPAKPFLMRPIPAGERLHIGFLSSEIGAHPVSNFLESYLRHYDRKNFEVTLYATAACTDDRGRALMSLPDRARDLSGVTDDEAREQIIGDSVDILIETSSHSGDGRLRMLSQRCAPIQCHYIGYFGTTGVDAIDYFIGDDEVSPPEFSAHFSERLFRLSRLWTAYTPPMAPPKAAAKAAGTEAVLGSFGSLSKAGDDVLDLWSALLRAFPATRLVLKDGLCADQGVRDRVLTSMKTAGVDASRVEFLPSTATWYEHMQLYNRLDIVLDTFPYNSATTAFEALLMGTPLVAMRQDWMGGRVSAALVKALGHPEWIATDKEQYVAIVGQLLASNAHPAGSKRDLQEKVLRSPLCDAISLSRALEEGFVEMMHDHNARYRAA